MAHECPNCGMTCHCGGDIDDICFSGTVKQYCCTHCFTGDHDEDDDWFGDAREEEDETPGVGCVCGAYAFSPDGKLLHIADCVCGSD